MMHLMSMGRFCFEKINNNNDYDMKGIIKNDLNYFNDINGIFIKCMVF